MQLVRRRHPCLVSVSCAVFCLLAISNAEDASGGSETCTSSESCPSSHNLECGVYMAPSTLGKDSNLGIFTGKPLEPGEVVNFPEIVIPLAFREWGVNPPLAYGDGEVWDRYLWPGSTANIESFDTYDRTEQKSVFVPGVGCTVNSVLDLHNIESTKGSQYDSLVERLHPSAGAFSPYHSSETIATQYIPAGAELLADYGESWIPWIPNIPVLQNSYLDGANSLMREFEAWAMEMKAKHGENEVSEELLERLYQMTRKFPHSSKTFSVLPPTLEDWKSTKETREYWRSQYQVSIEWLQEHGKCQDHIRPGHSTIPHAGRGAFATRFLPKGSVVGYAPLIHVAYAFDQMTRVRDHSNTTHPDLIWNYSFSHRNSTITLTPYGGMVNYINHSPEPNVRIQWPTKDLVAHKPYWLEQDLEFIRYSTANVGLSFDYIALRDIQEGEEVFIDYGKEWQEAWDEHVARWQPPEDATDYVHSSRFEVKLLKTPSELRNDPYPSNLVTICAESYHREGDKYVFIPVLRDWNVYVPCEVVSRSHGGRYAVRLDIAEPITVYNVPYPGGIRLVDRAYSQDWHLSNSFRHKIMIPDDMFPSSWKNSGYQ